MAVARVLKGMKSMGLSPELRYKVYEPALAQARNLADSHPLLSLELLRRIPKVVAFTEEILRIRAQAEARMGRFEEALKIVHLLCAKAPTSDLLLIKGRLLAAMLKFTSAEQAWLKAIRLNATNYEAIIELILARYDAQDFDGAMELCKQVPSTDRSHAAAQNVRGLCLLRKEHYQEALDCFDTSLSVNSAFSGACLNKARTLCRMGKWQESMTWYQRGLKLQHGIDWTPFGSCEGHPLVYEIAAMDSCVSNSGVPCASGEMKEEFHTFGIKTASEYFGRTVKQIRRCDKGTELLPHAFLSEERADCFYTLCRLHIRRSPMGMTRLYNWRWSNQWRYLKAIRQSAYPGRLLERALHLFANTDLKDITEETVECLMTVGSLLHEYAAVCTLRGQREASEAVILYRRIVEILSGEGKKTNDTLLCARNNLYLRSVRACSEGFAQWKDIFDSRCLEKRFPQLDAVADKMCSEIMSKSPNNPYRVGWECYARIAETFGELCAYITERVAKDIECFDLYRMDINPLDGVTLLDFKRLPTAKLKSSLTKPLNNANFRLRQLAQMPLPKNFKRNDIVAFISLGKKWLSSRGRSVLQCRLDGTIPTVL